MKDAQDEEERKKKEEEEKAKKDGKWLINLRIWKERSALRVYSYHVLVKIADFFLFCQYVYGFHFI